MFHTWGMNSYSTWTATSPSYRSYQAAAAQCTQAFIVTEQTEPTVTPSVLAQYGHSVEFWRIGGQTLNVRECEWLATFRSPGMKREGETNGPRFAAARDRAFAKLGATATEQAAIIDYHLTAAAANHTDDTTGWMAYRAHTRAHMHAIRSANK